MLDPNNRTQENRSNADTVHKLGRRVNQTRSENNKDIGAELNTFNLNDKIIDHRCQSYQYFDQKHDERIPKHAFVETDWEKERCSTSKPVVRAVCFVSPKQDFWLLRVDDDDGSGVFLLTPCQKKQRLATEF